jgi:hypothetical protein
MCQANLERLPRGLQVALALGLVALLAFPFFSTGFYALLTRATAAAASWRLAPLSQNTCKSKASARVCTYLTTKQLIAKVV